MKKEKRFSDEFLNSFVDNQLAPEEKSRTYVEISADPELNRQVCELRKLHDLVQFAYQNVPAPPRSANPTRTSRGRWASAAAAIVILTAGVTIGLKLETQDKGPVQASSVLVAKTAKGAGNSRATLRSAMAGAPKTSLHRAAIAKAAVEPVRLVTGTETILDTPRSINDVHIGNVRNKVLIHIAHDDQQRLAQALEEIEGLMRYYRETGQSAHVEVVINGRGMELVRVDKSTHAREIARLQKNYDNLTFAACQNTIDRLKREDGIDVHLLPGVVITDSGMAEIMRRQHQGWTYLQV